MRLNERTMFAAAGRIQMLGRVARLGPFTPADLRTMLLYDRTWPYAAAALTTSCAELVQAGLLVNYQIGTHVYPGAFVLTELGVAVFCWWLDLVDSSVDVSVHELLRALPADLTQLPERYLVRSEEPVEVVSTTRPIRTRGQAAPAAVLGEFDERY